MFSLMRVMPVSVAVAVGMVQAGAIAQGIEFSDVAAARGVAGDQPAQGFTTGIAAADYDDDGDIDFFVPAAFFQPNRLYQNDGSGNFSDVVGEVGLDATMLTRSALFFDYDGDGDLDLVTQHDQYAGASPFVRPLSLYRQEADGTFTDVTTAAGLSYPLVQSSGVHGAGMCAGDINNDGYLDLCAVQWSGDLYVLLNGGDGTFTDITVSSGVSATADTPWQPVMFDFNDDGWLDIFIAVDFAANRLWINQGNNTFVDVAPAAACSSSWNEMGVALGDYDNDGRFDLYVTNIDLTPLQIKHNALYHNTSSGGSVSFTELSQELGVANGGWGWGCTFFDADRDGQIDIAATNGFATSLDQFVDDTSVFFWNQPGGFEDQSDTVGFNDDLITGALMAFDYDRDGDLDLLQSANPGQIRLMECNPASNRRGTSNGYLVIKPRQEGPNTRAIGAVVRLTIGEVTQSRVITAGISHCSQEPAEAFFGVGDAATVDCVKIQWPDGSEMMLEDVAVNQVLTVDRADEIVCEGDANGDALVNLADLLGVLANWGSDGSEGGDVNGDSSVNLADLLSVLANWGNDCQ